MFIVGFSNNQTKGGGGVSRQVISEFYIAHNSFYANDSIGLCVCLHVEC